MIVDDIVQKYEALGVQLWVDVDQLRFRAPAGTLTQEHIKELRSCKQSLIEHLKKQEPVIIHDGVNRYEPFPLTDIQAAYLVGRNNDYELGGVGCHAYVELTMPVMDHKRLEDAWHKVISRHDMLRAIVSTKGYQQVLQAVVLPLLNFQDLRGMDEGAMPAAIEQVRRLLADKQYLPDKWPLYEMFLTTTNNKSILHISLDMLIADFVSISVILKELDHYYYHPEQPLAEPEVTYRDIILFEKSDENRKFKKVQKDRDRQYWLKRIDQLPEAPRLPVFKELHGGAEVTFERHYFVLEKPLWSTLSQQAKYNKITPSGAVLAAFSEVIGLWSDESNFCINITVLNRPEADRELNIVGDFTAVNVLEVNTEGKSTFVERAASLQHQLWSDLQHNLFSGVEVLREMNRRRNKNVIIPVVYTSTIGADDDDDTIHGEYMTNAKLTYGITQTPQVWVDCQVAEHNGALHLNWDVRSGIFPNGMINEVFAVLKKLLTKMAEAESCWFEHKPVHLSKKSFLPPQFLLESIQKVSWQSPDTVALFNREQQVSYQELSSYIALVQQALLKKGCQQGDVVAVCLEKGVWQAAAMLGILLAGYTYLPVEEPLSLSNIEDSVLKKRKIRHFLTEHRRMAQYPLPQDSILVDYLKPTLRNRSG
ncbi:condensation domain-containing protein [Sporomusa sphaeroides]|uniref:condensation domain-containing protein n=1 Tax=Sporomusa sphaeroides TaxID=47679 RepID=UPI002C2EF899|nr:condensation domain-containing protein [Sporomusa sphaeroides]HML33609.1 condensation domain-containing protein [Sporomusa sphaeroides]